MDTGDSPTDGERFAATESLLAAAVSAQERGAVTDAATLLERVLSTAPAHPEALFRYALLALQAGRADVALPIAARAAAADPRSVYARNLYGIVLRQNGRLAEAIAQLSEAVAIDPHFLDARINLGNALREAGDANAALPHYEQAVALDPQSVSAYNNLGTVYRDLRRPTEAIAAYRRALALDPRHAWAHANLGNMLKDLGDTSGALAEFRRSLALAPERSEVWSNLLLTLNCSDDVTATQVAAEHCAYGAYFAPRLPALPPREAQPRSVRLRVGYVSSDFRRHAVARFFEPLLEAHDRSRYEIFCYYNQPSGDDVTARVEAMAEHFLPIAGLSDRTLAQRIRQDGIDILIDLNGHTADNRLPLFFLRPAPVQATWLGYHGGTGVPTIDWRITDAYADSLAADNTVGLERAWRLPQTLWCYRPYAEAPAVGALPAATQPTVTFVSLNNPGKVSPTTLAMWSEILRALPDSRLLLLAAAHADRAAELREGFAARGVAAERIDLVARLPLRDYLALYGRVDIALDTYPYTGGTTTCDALWMGVPVVTRSTDRPFGRSGASILANLGMPQWVAATVEQYVAIALALARDRAALTSLRGELRERMRASPLTDARQYARDFEAMLESMWREHEASAASCG